MKRLKEHWSVRPISYMLSLAMMVMPVFMTLLAGAGPARADNSGHTAAPSWAVLDFSNNSGYGGNEVGRLASDALVVELGKTNKYEVIPRQDTMQGLQNLGLTLPLDPIGIQKLGRDRSIDGVVTGEVAAVSMSSNPRQATVSVVIRVTDTASGELVNGAIAAGASSPRPGPVADDDALVNQAIDHAIFAAVKQITKFNLPKATVLAPNDKYGLLLNHGTRDGLYDGLNMVVTRNGAKIGLLRVINAKSDDSDAAIVEGGMGIRPGDRATAIYEVPPYSIVNNVMHVRGDVPSERAPDAGHKRDLFSGPSGLLIAILAGALLLNIVHRGESSGALSGGEIGSPEAISNRVDVLGGGYGAPPVGLTGLFMCPVAKGPTDPNDVESSNVFTDWVPIAVKVTANTGNIPAFHFIEYHVYRSNFPTILSTPLSGGTTTAGGGGGITSNFTPIPEFAQDTQGPLLIFDDGQDMPPISAKKVDPITGGTITVSSTSCVQGTGIQNVGDRFNYLIEGLYSEAGNVGLTAGGTTTTGGQGTGGGTGTGALRNTGRSPSNFVTYIEPVLLPASSFQTSSSGANFVVSVQATRGANEYTLEFSADPLFRSFKQVQKKEFIGTPIPQTAPRKGDLFSFNAFDLTKAFPGATQLFVRVGARDIQNGPGLRLNPYVYPDPVQVDAGFLQ